MKRCSALAVRVGSNAASAALLSCRAAFTEARDECGTPFGDEGPPQLSEEERQEMQETMLEFAACMREHGVDMPDPDFSGGGARMQFRAGAGGVDPESPTFQKAQEACQDIIEDAFGARGPGLRVGGGPGEDETPSTNRDEDAS